MLIMNPTPVTVIAKHDGGTYAFRAGEQKEVFNNYAARHILGRWGKFGLVDITFDKRVSEKYIDHELYIHDQALSGMENYIASLEEKIERFQIYDEECGEKKSVQRTVFARKCRGVQKELDEAFKALASLEKVDQNDLMQRKAQKLLEQAALLQKEAEKLGSKSKRGRRKSASENVGVAEDGNESSGFENIDEDRSTGS